MAIYFLDSVTDGDIYDGITAWDDAGNIVNTINHYLRIGEQYTGASSKARYRSLMKFHIGSIPAGFSIERARLYIYYRSSVGDDIANAAPDSGDIGHIIVDHLDDFNYLSADDFEVVAADANIGTIITDDTVPAGWYYLDVTSYVDADFAGGSSSSFRFRQSTEGAYAACTTSNLWYITSKRSGMYEPYLEVICQDTPPYSPYSSRSFSSSSSSSSSYSFSSSSSDSSSSFSFSEVYADNAVVVPSTFLTGDTICASYDYHGSYPEAGSILRWYKNGVWLPLYNNVTCFPAIGIRGDTWIFTITPNDGYHYGETVTSAPGIMSNNPPSAPTYVEIIPHNPQPTDDLKAFFGGSVDPDGDRVTYKTFWYKNDVEMTTYRNTTTIPYTELSIGDSIRLAVVATDGYADSE